MPRQFTRAVSPLERLWIVADQLTTPFAVQLVIEGSGELDPEAWRRALAAAGAANPGTRLLLRRRFGRLRWVDGGLPPRLRIVDGRAWNGLNPAGADFLRDPLCLRRGPSAEVLLVEGEPRRIVFRAHHAVSDGRGLCHWAHEVFRALRGEELLGGTSTVTDRELAARLREKPTRTRDRGCLAPTGSSDPGESENGASWARTFVPGRHSALIGSIAVLAARRAREFGTGRVTFHVPVDLRQYFPDQAPSTGNLTGMIPVVVEPDCSAGDVARRIEGMVASGRAADIVLRVARTNWLPLGLMRFLGRRWASRCHRTDRWGSSGALSNFGLLPVEALSGGGFTAATSFSVPPPSYGTCLMLLLVGHAGGVEICASIPHPLASRGRLESFVAELGRELAESARTTRERAVS